MLFLSIYHSSRYHILSYEQTLLPFPVCQAVVLPFLKTHRRFYIWDVQPFNWVQCLPVHLCSCDVLTTCCKRRKETGHVISGSFHTQAFLIFECIPSMVAMLYVRLLLFVKWLELYLRQSWSGELAICHFLLKADFSNYLQLFSCHESDWLHFHSINCFWCL